MFRLPRALQTTAAAARLTQPRNYSNFTAPWNLTKRCYSSQAPPTREKRTGFIWRADAIFTAAIFAVGGYVIWRKEKAKRNAIDTVQSGASVAPPPDDYTVIFVLGGPGAGKGTQCANLVRDFGFVHLSAGDLLRAEKQRPGSEFGEMINTYIKEGKIVPMEVTIALLEKAMKEADGKRFLIDGFPRAMDQALKFEETVCKSRAVLYFECPESEMLKRLLNRGESSGRTDDNIESIKKRFKTFVDVSMPVIDHYAADDKVITVGCLNTPEKVYAETKKQIAKAL